MAMNCAHGWCVHTVSLGEGVVVIEHLTPGWGQSYIELGLGG